MSGSMTDCLKAVGVSGGSETTDKKKRVLIYVSGPEH